MNKGMVRKWCREFKDGAQGNKNMIFCQYRRLMVESS